MRIVFLFALVLIRLVELRRLFNEARQASGINRELIPSLMGFGSSA